MTFSETSLCGAYVIDVDRKEDHRGYFARIWCQFEFESQGLSTVIAQANTGFNHKKGTLRGIHFQAAPAAEVKIVRCTRGVVYDVLVDLRPQSRTFCMWVAYELSARNGRMLYIPEGCGHGYQTLEDDTEIVYQASRPYAPKLARGVRYDDSAFGVKWPLPVTVISDADRNWPDFAVGTTKGTGMAT